MAVNLKIKNAQRANVYQTSAETQVRKTSRFVDLKLDLSLQKVGAPYYFDQKIVNGVDITIATDEEAIKEYLKNLFSCAPGDLYLHPLFGLNLKQFCFEPITVQSAERIGNFVHHSVDDITNNIFDTPAGRNNYIKLKKVYINPNVESGAFELEIIFTIKPLDKEVSILGNISPQDGVYFITK